jgi:cobalt-zinc-cadmium efflux system membrane fusion protein
MRQSGFLFIVLLTGLLPCLSGCDRNETPAAAASAKPASGGGARVIPIPEAQKQFLTIEAVGASRAGDVLTLPGRVTFRPQAQSAVGAPVAGRVLAVLVRAGEVVKAGAPLLAIESAEAAAARASLDQAATRLAVADSAYRRHAEMVDKGVGLAFEKQEAEGRLKEARGEHERARAAAALIGAGQGARVSVRAPVDGVVMAIRVGVGASVVPGGEPLIELGDPTRLLVVAQAPESDLAGISAGQEAQVDIPALAARMAARVENFSPRVDPESRRTQVYLALAGRPDGLRAGMMAQVVLRVSVEESISVPATAVLIKEGKRRVVYVERPDGTFEAREVQTGRNREGRVVILKGLTAGEKVVMRGALLLDAQAEQLL